MPEVQQKAKLVDQITGLLIKAGYPNANNWIDRVNPDVHVVNDERIELFLVNRYWREIIGMFTENTMQVRFCLDDTIQISEWLRLFESEVIPCLMRNTQPKMPS